MDYKNRKSPRLRGYDYSAEGAYFITICTRDRQALLCEITDGGPVGADIIRPKLTEYGEITDKAINAIPFHYPNIKIDKYVIMPDHIHLILIISNDNGRIISAPTVMRVIGQMKQWISKQIGVSIWQKSYFDHIIRDEKDYLVHLNYIEQNPVKWLLCNRQEPEEGDL